MRNESHPFGLTESAHAGFSSHWCRQVGMNGFLINCRQQSRLHMLIPEIYLSDWWQHSAPTGDISMCVLP